jgi:hypothetical protein
MKKLERDALLADREAVVRTMDTIPTDDELGRLSFSSRLTSIDEQLGKLEALADNAGSVALIFHGGPVHGSRAIDAGFAVKAIDAFHMLVKKTVALAELGSLGGRGPVPQHSEVDLDITELVRGSVGFLLEENTKNLEIADTAVKHAIDDVTLLVSRAASEDNGEFEKAVETLDDRRLVSLRDFFRTLDEGRATVDIVVDARDAVLDAPAVRRALERVEATEITEEESTVVGELLGLLPEGKRFEMKLRGTGEIVRGPVLASFAAEYLELIEKPHGGVVGRLWRARMRIREIRERNKPPRKLYSLIGLLEQVATSKKRRKKRRNGKSGGGSARGTKK